jgi:hypothetical protein
VVVREQVAYELIAWAPPPDEAAARAFLDAFTLRAGAVADASLAPRAVDAAYDSDVVGETFALRGGKWRDFEHGIAVQAPPGWRVVAGRAAKRAHPLASVALDKAGMRALVYLAPGGQRGLAHGHDEAKRHATELGRDIGTVSKGQMGDSDALITYGMRGDVPRARLATSLHDEFAVSLLVWSDGALPKEEIDAIAGAVSFEPTLQAVEATTEVYRDHRFGFQFHPPHGWLRQDVTPAELATLGTMVRWELDGRWIAVIAVALSGNARSRGWMVSYLEQLLRDAIAPHTLGAVAHEASVFADRPSVQISWRSELQAVHALVFSQPGVAFAVVSHDHGEDGFAHAKRELTLLP